YVRDGKRGIHFVDRVSNRLCEKLRVARSANQDVLGPSARVIDVECRRSVQAKLVNVSNDADDGEPARLGRERAEIDATTDRVGARPEAALHGFINKDVGQVPVFCAKNAALEKRNVRGGKVAEADGAGLGDGAPA